MVCVSAPPFTPSTVHLHTHLPAARTLAAGRRTCSHASARTVAAQLARGGRSPMACQLLVRAAVQAASTGSWNAGTSARGKRAEPVWCGGACRCRSKDAANGRRCRRKSRVSNHPPGMRYAAPGPCCVNLLRQNVLFVCATARSRCLRIPSQCSYLGSAFICGVVSS